MCNRMVGLVWPDGGRSPKPFRFVQAKRAISRFVQSWSMDSDKVDDLSGVT